MLAFRHNKTINSSPSRDAAVKIDLPCCSLCPAGDPPQWRPLSTNTFQQAVGDDPNCRGGRGSHWHAQSIPCLILPSLFQSQASSNVPDSPFIILTAREVCLFRRTVKTVLCNTKRTLNTERFEIAWLADYFRNETVCIPTGTSLPKATVSCDTIRSVDYGLITVQCVEWVGEQNISRSPCSLCHTYSGRQSPYHTYKLWLNIASF